MALWFLIAIAYVVLAVWAILAPGLSWLTGLELLVGFGVVVVTVIALPRIVALAIGRHGLGTFRALFLAAYATIAATFFFLTIKVYIYFGLPAQTLPRKIMQGVSGAAGLTALVQPTVIRRGFFKEGQLTRLGRWTTRTFRFSEDKLPTAISFPWKLSLALGVLVAVVNLVLSAGK